MSLHQLASSSDDAAPQRASLAWLLPAGLLAGFIALIWLLFGDRLLPAIEVQTVPTQTLRLGADLAAAPASSNAPPARAGAQDVATGPRHLSRHEARRTSDALPDGGAQAPSASSPSTLKT